MSKIIKVLAQVDAHIFYFYLNHDTLKSLIISYVIKEYLLGQVDHFNGYVEVRRFSHLGVVSIIWSVMASGVRLAK